MCSELEFTSVQFMSCEQGLSLFETGTAEAAVQFQARESESGR